MLKDDYPVYHKRLPSGLTHVDVYAVLRLFEVEDSALSHAIKKLLCAGKRGAKDRTKDLQEARDSITRALELDEAFGQNNLDELFGKLNVKGVTEFVFGPKVTPESACETIKEILQHNTYDHINKLTVRRAPPGTFAGLDAEQLSLIKICDD